MHVQLVSMYAGKYVAVLNGQVVDNDIDERALVQRVYQKFGYQPIYVQLVTSGSLPVYRLVSPQVVRPTIIRYHSLMPKKAGARVKTDRRDAGQLARLARSGARMPGYVPPRGR